MADSNPNLTRDHLANERTYLAWIRTSITVVGLGFVVGKFGVWLRFLAATSNTPHPPHDAQSTPLAIAMVAVGALLALIGAWRYRRVRRAITENRPAVADATVSILTVIITLFAIATLAVLTRTVGP